jgi:hypothetical protein
MAFCLILILIKPQGLINFDNLQGKDWIVAQSEGAANCTSTLKLKNNGKFIYESICFGMYKTKGKYKISNDTIYFENHSERFFEYKSAVVDKKENTVWLYKNNEDKTHYGLPIIKLN